MAGKQWGIGRLYSETVKRMLAERDIRSPSQIVTYRTIDRPQILPPLDDEAATQP
ncbi:hypothetical protein N8D56_06795 [Devosia sp. A8/3-2]|nr:hypothetical protein N8D56_06795 [Devosia sp. A8/3-2]